MLSLDERRLVQTTAHELINLLGVILNFSTLVGRRLSDSTAVGDLGEIGAAAERAVDLARKLAAVVDG
jgi:signal transduction histidine kinase